MSYKVKEMEVFDVVTDELELVICSPKLTTFNGMVRNRLNELDVDFRTDW